MGEISALARTYLRRNVVEGVESSPINQPDPAQGIAVFVTIDAALSDIATAVAAGDAVVEQERADLFADLAPDEDTLGFVIADPTPAYRGIYIKVGASGTGSWDLTDLALPSTFASDLAAVQSALDDKAPIDSPTFTGPVSGIDKSMVGLGNVDNTSDADKPVSSATASALGAKASTSDLTAETDARIAADATKLDAVAYSASAPQNSMRPGDAPYHFQTVITGTATGQRIDLAAGISIVNDGDMGASVEVHNVTVHVTTAAPTPILLGRVYRARYRFRRETDPADPLNDAVEYGVRFMLSDKSANNVAGGNRVIATLPLEVSDGVVDPSAVTFALTGVTGVDHTIPADSVYARPWVRMYGTDHRTRIAFAEFEDITDAFFGGSDVSDLAADVAALSSTVSTLDTDVVKLSGAQTINDPKTFSTAPVVPDDAFAIAKTIGLQAELDTNAGNISTLRTDTETGFEDYYVAILEDDALRTPYIVNPLTGALKLFGDNRTGRLGGDFDFGSMSAFRAFHGMMMVDLPADARFWPIGGCVLADGKIPIAYDRVREGVTIQNLLVEGASAGATVERTSLSGDLDFGVVDNSKNYNAMGIGQSLIEGSNGDPPFSLAQPFQNRTWPEGPKTRKTGNGYGATLNLDPMTSAIPLEEQGVETVVSGTLNTISDMAFRKKGISDSTLKMFGVTAGRGGTSIELLREGAPPEGSNTENLFQIIRDHIAQIAALGVSEGFDPVVFLLPVMHGEADQLMTAAEYKAEATGYFDEVQAYIMTELGQTTRPHFLLSQPGEGITASDGGPAQAMYELSMERDDCHLAGGVWHLPDADGTHLVNHGYRRRAVEFGVMGYDILVRRVVPLKCKMLRAVWNGAQVVTYWEVETPPIKIDTTTFSEVQDYGLRLVDDVGATIEFTAPPTFGSDGVTMYHSVASAPPVGSKIRCAFDYQASEVDFVDGATCNIRDSTEEPFTYLNDASVVVEQVRRNWAAHSIVEVVHSIY